MGEVLIANAVTVGMVIAGFIGNAIYLKGNFGARIVNAEQDIRDLKENVRYADTCDKTHEGIEPRIANLEAIRNGGKRR